MVDYLDSCYRSRWRLWRDDPTRTVAGCYYWAPPGAPVYPGEHYLASARWHPEAYDAPALGEVYHIRRRWVNGGLGVTHPPATRVGGASCDGFTGLTGSPAVPALVAGIDPRCWSNAGLPVPIPRLVMVTPDWLQKATEVTDVWTDSRIYDPGTGILTISAPVQLDGCVSAECVILPVLGSAPEPPPAGERKLYAALGGLATMDEEGMVSAVVIASGTGNGIPKFSGGPGVLVDSRISDPGGSAAVAVGASVDVSGPVRILQTTPAAGRGLMSVTTGSGPNTVQLELVAARTGAGAFAGGLYIYADATTVRVDLVCTQTDRAFSINGVPGQDDTVAGFSFEGGIFTGFSSPSAGELATAFGLGSAAYEDSSAFEPAGSGGVPVGSLLPLAGPLPAGYLECDGSAVSRATFAALFAAIGTTWGAGDGSTTFNLPDLRGRAAVGAGEGPGLTEHDLGDQFGEEEHTLTIDEIPAHTHD